MNLEGKQIIAVFSGGGKELCTVSTVSGGRVIAVRHSDGEIVSLDPAGTLRLVERDPAIRQSLRDSELVEAVLRNAWPNDGQPDRTHNVVAVAKKYIAAVRLEAQFGELDAQEAKEVADTAAKLRDQLEETSKMCGQLRTDLASEIQKGLELRDERNQAINRICTALPGWFASPPSLETAADALLRALGGRAPSDDDDEVRGMVEAREGETTAVAVRRRLDAALAESDVLRSKLAVADQRWSTDLAESNSKINEMAREIEKARKEISRHRRMRELAEHDRDQAEQDAQAMSDAIPRHIAARTQADGEIAALRTQLVQVREALGSSIQPDGTDDVVQKARDAGRALAKLGPIEEWAREAAGFVMGDGLPPQMLDAHEQAKAVRQEQSSASRPHQNPDAIAQQLAALGERRLESGLRPLDVPGTEASPPAAASTPARDADPPMASAGGVGGGGGQVMEFHVDRSQAHASDAAHDVTSRLDAIGQAIAKIGDLVAVMASCSAGADDGCSRCGKPISYELCGPCDRAAAVEASAIQTTAQTTAGPVNTALSDSVRAVILLARAEERGAGQIEGSDERATLDRCWNELSPDDQEVIELLSAELRRLGDKPEVYRSWLTDALGGKSPLEWGDILRTVREHRTVFTRAVAPAPADQPTPKYDPSKLDVWACVMDAAACERNASAALIDLMWKRRATGIFRYNTPLQPNNGRDAKRDLLEELLDATAYAAQDAIERGSVEDPSLLAQDEVFHGCLALLRRVFSDATSTGSTPSVDESSPT